MPLHLNALEKFGLYRLNQGPAPMVEILEMMSFKAIVAALKIGLFDAIGADGKSVKEIASITGSDPAGISLLMNLLVNLDYLKHRSGIYRNSRSAMKWLLSGSPDSIAALFHQFNDMASKWDYLETSIRNGRPPEMGWQWLDRQPGGWRNYHAGLKSSAVLISRELFRKVKLPSTAEHIIDLGDSHGQYCVEFCRRYPRLSGIVYDLPPAEKTAAENIRSSGMSERISFWAGDFVTDPIGSGHDVILMFNVIRIFRPDELKSLFRKIYESLAVNGMVIIMDHLGHRSSSRFMKANALLILLELYNSTEGKTHDRNDVAEWLRDSGFSSVTDYNLKRSPGLGVVTAIKS
jgi:hypothetical protein